MYIDKVFERKPYQKNLLYITPNNYGYVTWSVSTRTTPRESSNSETKSQSHINRVINGLSRYQSQNRVHTSQF